MSSTSCYNCGSKENLRSNGECATCANARLKKIMHDKHYSTPERRAKHREYMREYRQRKKRKNA